MLEENNIMQVEIIIDEVTIMFEDTTNKNKPKHPVSLCMWKMLTIHLLNRLRQLLVVSMSYRNNRMCEVVASVTPVETPDG
jgi:hypothetical protein